jgi:Fe-S cluster assembly protein SufD
MAGATLARQQMSVRMAGARASLNLACGYVAGSGQHTDYTLEVVHEAAHTTSRILAKGVAAGDGRGVVQGKVVVRSEAQKSDSHQMSRALLLSTRAEIDQKPELEIFADDVKCGHGATVGTIDANQLFYLQSRGVPEHEARSMLIAAFMCEITERVPEALGDKLEDWLGVRMARLAG